MSPTTTSERRTSLASTLVKDNYVMLSNLLNNEYRPKSQGDDLITKTIGRSSEDGPFTSIGDMLILARLIEHDLTSFYGTERSTATASGAGSETLGSRQQRYDAIVLKLEAARKQNVFGGSSQDVVLWETRTALSKMTTEGFQRELERIQHTSEQRSDERTSDRSQRIAELRRKLAENVERRRDNERELKALAAGAGLRCVRDIPERAKDQGGSDQSRFGGTALGLAFTAATLAPAAGTTYYLCSGGDIVGSEN